MDFDFSEEQQLLQDSARRMVSEKCPPSMAKLWDDESTPPTALFSEMAKMDWFSLPYPEEIGGAGAGPIELAIIAEALGGSSFDIAMSYIANVNAGLSFYNWSTPEQRRDVFPDVVTGQLRFALAISEPEAGSDASAIQVSAVAADDHYVVNGEKLWCTGAGLPNTKILVYVRTGKGSVGRDGLSVLLVDPVLPGVELRRIPTLARHTLGTYSVSFSDVQVHRSALVGGENQGWSVLLSGLDLERVLISGAYVGAAQSTVDEAVSYGMSRFQSGRAVATNQALSHPLADLQTSIDASRLLTYRAAWLNSVGRPSLREGSMAKLLGSESYVSAARHGMQVMAAYGFSTESVMSFRYRESIVATISGGTSQIQRNIIARSMGIR